MGHDLPTLTMPAPRNPLHALGTLTPPPTFTVDKIGMMRVRDKIGRFITSLPKEVSKRVDVIGRDYERGLKASLRLNDIKWKGKLRKRTKSMAVTGKEGRKRVEILIPEYGVALDSMKEHFVSTDKYPLDKWMKEKWKKKHPDDKIPPVIKVKPHPWILAGYKFAREKASERLNIKSIVNNAYR